MGNCLIQCGCKKRVRPPTREIKIGDPNKTDIYPNNEIITSRYTGYNFLPKNLFYQFQRIANFYFLCIAIIQLFIDTPVPIYTSALPLLFVLTLTAVKQGYEDILRHRNDSELNNIKIDVFRNNQETKVISMDIRMGDIIKCQANQAFPCDMVMLSSSQDNGECYVTTASLDGETNLKVFRSIRQTSQYQNFKDLVDLQAKIFCPEPDDDLYKFSGRIEWEDQVYVLSVENVLLRGARLKDTEYIFGCAIYTGKDTKLSLNSKDKKTKFSQIEHRLNFFLIFYMILLVLESALLVVMRYILNITDNSWYVQEAETTAWRVIQDFLGNLVVLNYLIPISLYVTIEFVKIFGRLSFEWDLEMYDPVNDNPAKANTSDINEDLGQIEYLFSDKTGTLTCNEMVFQRCSVAGIKYLDGGDHFIIEEEIEGETLTTQKDVTEDPKELDRLMLILVLCHTVRAERDAEGTITYQASSPDEKAFIEACMRHSVVYEGQVHNKSIINFKGTRKEYEILRVLEFDSDRKCMSVIVKYPDGSYHLHTKGAESSLISKAVRSCAWVDVIMNHVNDFALLGLRTLVIGSRELSLEDVERLSKDLDTAKSSLENNEALVSEAFGRVETGLDLIGCTAVEDKLQDQVYETIVDLRTAGINVWVLTGDKEETAINISFLAGHFNTNQMLIRITKIDSLEECYRRIQNKLEEIEGGRKVSRLTEYALVLDGQSLNYALQTVIIPDLMRLIKKCNTVLCCRMTPLQKAEIVSMVRSRLKPEPVTAAIGDGANDVSMIMEAHVGIGLYGKEGRQAVRASDYAFTYFRHLRRALLVHGHWYYIRVAILVQFFFYKNIVFITPQLYFGFFSAYSAQTLYNFIYLIIYNFTLTSLPILLFAVVEQNLTQELLLAKPQHYRRNSKNAVLTWKQFFIWNILGLWHSVVIFFGTYTILIYDDTVSPTGGSYDIVSMGTFILAAVVITATVKIQLYTYNWTLITAVGLLITYIGNIVVLFLISAFLKHTISDTYQVWLQMWTTPFTYMALILLVFLCLTPDIVYKVYVDYEIETLYKEIKTRDTVPCNSVQGHENQSFEVDDTLARSFGPSSSKFVNEHKSEMNLDSSTPELKIEGHLNPAYNSKLDDEIE